MWHTPYPRGRKKVSFSNPMVAFLKMGKPNTDSLNISNPGVFIILFLNFGKIMGEVLGHGYSFL